MTREEAIRLLSATKLMACNEKGEPISDLYFALDIAIQALEQEPKTGHWILDDSDNSITCDICECKIYANDIINGEAYFCPNCGARITEE